MVAFMYCHCCHIACIREDFAINNMRDEKILSRVNMCKLGVIKKHTNAVTRIFLRKRLLM